MPKRSRVSLEDVADWNNLAEAAWLASKGKRDKRPVRAFMARLHENLSEMRREILAETIQVGQATTFVIHDPKQRTIQAPVFRERVLHHALMRQIGPILDRSLVHDTFACRVGKGSLAAVHRVQQHCRRFQWYGKLDVRQYFASICHDRLLGLLSGKLKDKRLLALVGRILEASPTEPGRGLSLGALTSQNFANFYLGTFDRYLLETLKVRGFVRYMDDVAWWCDSKSEVVAVAKQARAFLVGWLGLMAKEPMQINRSLHGIGFCGYRVFPGRLQLSKRRRKLYAAGRRRWERRYAEGKVTQHELQSAYSSLLGMTLHSDATSWRRGELQRHPLVEACRDI